MSWNSISIVSGDTDNWSRSPEVAVDNSGNVHIVWYDIWASTYVVFYRMWNATTKTWGSRVAISDIYPYSLYPTIAVDSLGNVHVAWSNQSVSNCDILYKKWNATHGWSTAERVTPYSSSNRAVKPQIAVDGSNTVHFVWENGSASQQNYQVFYRYWDPIGGWSTIELVTPGTSISDTYPRIAVNSSGTVHIVYQNETTGPNFYVYYRRKHPDYGWSSEILISSESSGYSKRPQIAIDSSNNAHVVWFDTANYLGATGYNIFYKFWNATSNTWNTTQVVTTNDYNDLYPTIAIDGSSKIYVAWSKSISSKYQIYYKSWPTFTTIRTASELVSTGCVNDSESVHIAVENSGKVHIVWKDKTELTGYAFPVGDDEDIFYRSGTEEQPSNLDDLLLLLLAMLVMGVDPILVALAYFLLLPAYT
ncbi:MAG: hypothetical protein ACTSO9_18925 [Candidatus Helarchaeota archaeon]